MNKSNMLLRIEARTKSIWEELSKTDPEIISGLFISPAEVQEELDKIEDQAIIDQFTKELQQALDTSTNESLQYEAICYEWYHDAYDLENPAIGFAYQKCAHHFLSSINRGPDTNWTVVNDNMPTLSGQVLDLNRLSVSLITKVWYELIGRSEEKLEYIDNNIYDNMPMMLFDELFKLKLFTMIDAAYGKLTGTKPAYFSVAIYGYWHSVITDYRVENQTALKMNSLL